ncbi:MAG: DUF3990 domain-containing protein [Lachnospiraceae bacterium]|nr:DUF3990 domain-containing protein [Lachnospiraceae bacterium]
MTVEEVNKATGISIKELNRLNCDLWYHGTSPDGAENIRENGPQAGFNIGNMLDFGAGFYLTDTKERAESYISRIPVLTKEMRFEKRKEWSVIEFRLNPFELLFGEGNEGKYTYKNFPKHDEEFAKFAFYNRLSNVYRENHHGYDIIWGVMSDNLPDQVIYDYTEGLLTYEEAIEKLQKPNSMKQLYISRQEICDMLEITDIIQIVARS